MKIKRRFLNWLLWVNPIHYRALLSFPHVFSGNPGKIKHMDARLMHSGMTNCAKFAVFKKVHGKECRTLKV
jgi:hypothetical protein